MLKFKFILLAISVFFATYVWLDFRYAESVVYGKVAMRCLSSIYDAEFIYRNEDVDFNGLNDFWVGGLRGLYAVSGEVIVPLIDDRIRYADFSPIGNTDKADPSDYRTKTKPFSFYYFKAMKYNVRNEPYNKGNDKNEKEFAYIAIPIFGKKDWYVFIVNQDGHIYRRNDSKIYTTEYIVRDELLKWPAENQIEREWEFIYDCSENNK